MKEYTSFRHDFALEELAKEKVGSGEPCGYFVSIGNGVYQNGSDDLIPFEGGEEDVSHKMIAYFSELEDAQNCADNIYIGEDTNIGWVRIEDQGGDLHSRYVTAVPTTMYRHMIENY